jgi:outer membrane protein
MFNKTLSILSLILSSIAIGIYLYNLNIKSSKTAYIKSEILFNEFKLTKELKAKFENIASTRKNILDSLLLDLKYTYSDKRFPREKYLEKEKYYLSRKELFESQNQELTENYDHQIWERINQYIKEFGEHNHYEYIFGAKGDGSLLFASDKNDITKDVTEFMNSRYNGNDK